MKHFFSLITALIASAGLMAQVNLHKGTPEVTVPIYNFDDNNNRLSTSVSVDYEGGNGIKVNDIAPDIGLGWRLNAGGVILRKQNGEPDDQKWVSPKAYIPWKAYYSQGMWAAPPAGAPEVGTLEQLDYYIYGDGYLFTTIDPSIPVDAAAAYSPVYERTQDAGIYETGFKASRDILADREQDVFKFEFNGRSGSFIISKTGVARTLEDSRLKISFTYLDMSADKIRTRIKSFTITDEAGIKYVFNDNSLEQLCTYKRTKYISYAIDGTVVDQPMGGAGFPRVDTYNATPIDQYIISKWYLSDIINPATSKTIHFEYDDYLLDYITEKNIGYAYPTSGTNATVSITNARMVCKEKRIKKITMPDDASVSFLYNTVDRSDLANSKSLKGISISNKDHKENYELQYGYLFKKEIREENSAFTPLEKKFTRLCLRSIRKKGSQHSEEPYRFEYITGNATNEQYNYIPPRLTFPTDNFGYYNGYGILAEPQLDEAYVYPNYHILTRWVTMNEPQREKSNLTAYYTNGLLNKVINPYKGSTEFIFESNCSNDALTDYGGARVAKVIQFDGISHDNDLITEYKYRNEDGTSSMWGNDRLRVNYYTNIVRQFKSPVKTDVGKAAVAFAIPSVCNLSAALASSNKDVSLSYLDQVMGRLQSSIVSYVIGQLISDIGYLFAPDYINRTFTNFQYYPLSFKNPLPFQFSRVEVSKRSAISNFGKTIFEFTSDKDYPIDVPSYSFPFSNEQRCFEMVYGLPKKITFINAANGKVKEIENSYNYIKAVLNQNNNTSQSWKVLTAYSSLHYSNGTPMNGISSDAVVRKNYYPVTGRVELTKTAEALYDNNGNRINKTTDYIYNLKNFLQAFSTVTNSKGIQITTKTYYPEDYNLTVLPNLQKMVTANMVNAPVSSEIWQNGSANTPELLDASVTEYNTILNNDIKPVKTYRLQTNSPVSQNTIGVFNPDQLVRNNALLVPEKEVTYNGAGHPVQIKDVQKNNTVSTIYWYPGAYPVATATNASINEIAYTSFEKKAAIAPIPDINCGNINPGKWETTGGQVLDQPSVTGNNCYQLGTLKIDQCHKLVINKDYTLSFWANSSGFSVSGVSGSAVAGATINGWTYYEFDLPAGSSLPVITGSCKIDELRLYPKQARMITTTYEPGVGKTSECDINNRVTYYEYDDLGRVLLIRDQNKNLLKKFCYNYAGQFENCNICDSLTADWQNTYEPLRCQIVNCNNTGYLEREEKDMNRCSPTYNQTRWVVTGYTSLCNATSNVTLVYAAIMPGFTAVYTNPSTNQTYTFAIPSGQGTLGCIPAGTYNLTISNPANTINLLSFGTGCHINVGASANIKNVVVSAQACNKVTVSLRL